MSISAIIFDMDGLLIDSEPVWEAAGKSVLAGYGHQLSSAQYASSTGLRTAEWLMHWFTYFGISNMHLAEAEATIVNEVIKAIEPNPIPMPGVNHVLQYAIQKGYSIGVATSSPMRLAQVAIKGLGIGHYIQAVASAEHLIYGKPHPEVYLNCANMLGVLPEACLCFEDSFNGMIAAKAAKMRCVVVPAKTQLKSSVWGAADLKISSLQNVNDLLFQGLSA
ncbi:MAG: hexitol phosphatase HxpB [Bacteroidetes bacterium]|nr:MAG: hexitol phosphatase HxpB [Bacteroidota bacterium]